MPTLSNGYYVKNKPNESVPENYKQDPADPMICIPVFDCISRTSREVTEDCCQPYTQLECQFFNKDIKIVDCVNCESRNSSGTELHDNQE